MFSPSIVVQKHSSGGSIYGDSSFSGDFAPPVHGGNSLLRVAAGCDGGGGGGGSSSSLKSWAQQTEETYQLQLALALRLSSEAASVDDPNSLDLIPDDSSSSRLSSSRSAESISHRFWVNGCLSYSDKIPDGFYLIHGMDPYIWNMCTDLQDNGRIPSIDLLKSLDPRNESAFEVVVIDRRTDSKLKEMQNIVHSITFNCLSRDAVVDQLAQLVCNHMGVSASTREDEFVPIWKKISDGLKYCLGSVVLPIGSLSTGLCRHRALLFKVLADTIDLPCRIAKGCKYCNRHDATSCLVQFGSNREYLIDLIGKPGCKSEPDSLLNGPYSISISSPLHFPRFRPVETAINFRSLAEHYFSDCRSLNRVFKGPSSGAIVEQPGLELLDWNSPIHSKINNEVSHPFTRPRNSHLYESSSAQQNRRVPNVMNRIVPTVFFPAGRLRGTEKYYTGANGNAFNSQFESSQLVSSRPSSEVSLDMNDLVISWSDLVVRDRIGAGSFGTVHRAEWNRSEVAVKILMEQDFHPERREEFLREVSIMNRLRHPNIVLLMGAITEPPKLAIVTEYLSRGNLFKLLHKSGVGKVLDERRRLSMAYDVASGMNYLHRRSPPIVHRDLKSPNLLVAKNYTVKVGDFGLSRLKANTFLSSKTAAGTPEWMAPEVLRAELSNEKSDVYSFGVILWELATLHQPWSNLNPFQVVALVAYEGKRLEIPHNVNPQVATLIKACWADDPQARPPFSEIMDSLQSLLDAPAPQPGHGHSQYRT